jgi:glycosyltransferase involved in cell wall biosynthesis
MLVGHFGSLSATRNLLPFIEALEILETQRPDVVALTELHVYGGPLDLASAEKLADAKLPITVKSAVRHFGRIERDSTSGLSGREQVLQLMRRVDVLLLLHGQEPICAEYIPSKLYEYLWMQRPILATVYSNPQMAYILRHAGHTAIETSMQVNGANSIAKELTVLFERWKHYGLADNGMPSPYTTRAAVGQLVQWVQP